MKTRGRSYTARDAADVRKLEAMRTGARRDAQRAEVIELASSLARPFPPDAWASFAEQIHAFARDGIRYQHDPDRREQLEDARRVLREGRADCDGKARLAVALARSLGMEAEVWPVWKGPILAHVLAAYRWPGSRTYPGARRDGWVPGELTIKGAALGQDPRAIAPNPETGRLPLAG